MLLLKQFMFFMISFCPLESEVTKVYINLSYLDISPAIVNVLAEAGITSRKVLKHMTEKELREAGRKIGKEEAVVRAANMAMKRIREIKRQERAQDTAKTVRKPTMNQSLEYLKLSLHSKQCLHSVGIHNLEDLLKNTEKALLKIHALGKKGVKEIKEKLKNKGLELRITNGKGDRVVSSDRYFGCRHEDTQPRLNARAKRKSRRQKIYDRLSWKQKQAIRWRHRLPRKRLHNRHNRGLSKKSEYANEQLVYEDDFDCKNEYDNYDDMIDYDAYVDTLICDDYYACDD